MGADRRHVQASCLFCLKDDDYSLCCYRAAGIDVGSTNRMLPGIGQGSMQALMWNSLECTRLSKCGICIGAWLYSSVRYQLAAALAAHVQFAGLLAEHSCTECNR